MEFPTTKETSIVRLNLLNNQTEKVTKVWVLLFSQMLHYINRDMGIALDTKTLKHSHDRKKTFPPFYKYKHAYGFFSLRHLSNKPVTTCMLYNLNMLDLVFSISMN